MLPQQNNCTGKINRTPLK